MFPVAILCFVMCIGQAPAVPRWKRAAEASTNSTALTTTSTALPANNSDLSHSEPSQSPIPVSFTVAQPHRRVYEVKPEPIKIKRKRKNKKDRSTSSSSGEKNESKKSKSAAAVSASDEKQSLEMSISSMTSGSDSVNSKGKKKKKKRNKKYDAKSTVERHGWMKWHRKCYKCPDEMRMKWRDPRVKWICGAYQRARRSFKSLCMMHLRNCQDGTMFTKLHDHRCQNDTDDMSAPHGEHFFYDYKVKLLDESSRSSSEESSDTSKDSSSNDSSK